MVFEHAGIYICRNGKTAIAARLAGKHIFLAANANTGLRPIQRNGYIWLCCIADFIKGGSTYCNRGTITGANNGLFSAA